MTASLFQTFTDSVASFTKTRRSMKVVRESLRTSPMVPSRILGHETRTDGLGRPLGGARRLAFELGPGPVGLDERSVAGSRERQRQDHQR